MTDADIASLWEQGQSIFHAIAHALGATQPEAEDAISDAMAVFIEQVRAGETEHVESPERYVSGIVRFRVLAAIKAQRKYRAFHTTTDAHGKTQTYEPIDPSPAPKQQIYEKELRAQIIRARQDLSEFDRAILESAVVREEPRHVTMARLGITKKRYDQGKYRAKKRLRAAVENLAA